MYLREHRTLKSYRLTRYLPCSDVPTGAPDSAQATDLLGYLPCSDVPTGAPDSAQATDLLDVPTGAPDSAQGTDLLGIYLALMCLREHRILHKLQTY
ncbi:Hypothetical predicted protein [Octopus vulgaris]|uniref:Uncharacterized protein n=1 Tax=Octopus vulgaris TaxID=6645 RepID=A0AA36HHM9_OCTVU|nr:Hypothetical predicted protein [Octopus vulgaris]